MKKWIVILFLISIISCVHSDGQQQANKKKREELKVDTKILQSLDDSLTKTGDHQYYEKYIIKIDEMINKYPEQKKELKRVKKSMVEIYEY
jgi:uncharacterized OsmC-like protein